MYKVMKEMCLCALCDGFTASSPITWLRMYIVHRCVADRPSYACPPAWWEDVLNALLHH